MKYVILLVLLYIICDDVTRTNADDVETCTPTCFIKAVMTDAALCEKKEKNKRSLSFYYETKTGKCVSSYCLKDYGQYFETEKECSEKCQSCQKLLKKYNADDECLKTLGMQGTLKKTEEVVSPSNVWTFDTNSGKCKSIISNFHKFEKGWSIATGIALPTEEECNKRCPTIQ